jgi:hypothetical protein
MFSLLRPLKQATDGVKATRTSSNVLSFDPSSIVQAIAFHLLDEGKASAVNRESSEAAVDKLARRNKQLVIAADQWATMSNAQRLQWLLDHSHVVVKSGTSGRAMLMVRRWQPVSTWALWLWKRP